MTRRGDVLRPLALVLVLAAGPGCSGPPAPTLEVGRHRVRCVVPRGWEHLDHGRQQLFRRGEEQVSLVDLGPATREGMVRELRAAEQLWRDGRRDDAFERVRTLRSPALHFAPSARRAAFWRPWTDATYVPSAADSGEVGRAFEALIEGTAEFDPVTPERLLEYAVLYSSNPTRRQVAHREWREIHGARWFDVTLWDPVSHLYRTRLALLVNDGDLLVLATDRGLYERAEPGFEAVLASLVVERGAPAGR